MRRKAHDDFADQDELQAKSVSPMVKPTPGKNMFNFGSFVDSSNSASVSPPDKRNPLSPDNEASLIGNFGQPSKRHGIKLDICDDELDGAAAREVERK